MFRLLVGCLLPSKMDVSGELDMITKSLFYAFPTSITAKKLGYYKDGCYFLVIGSEGTPYKDNEIVSHAKDMFDVLDCGTLHYPDTPWGAYSLHTKYI